MKILDCESTNSIYKSLENILEVDRSTIESIFEEVDYKDFYNGNPYHATAPVEHLFCAVRNALPSTMDFDQTRWFHLTRTIETNNFDQGILPLGEHIESIWAFLYSLLDGYLSNQEWDDFRRNISKSNNTYAVHYRTKTGDRSCGGPFAILIKDVAIKAEEIGSHDYLRRGAEIVEHICNFFSKNYEFDLYKAYLTKTEPCIVKFVVNSSELKYIRAALNYLYSSYKRIKIDEYCNDCFDGRGTPVPKGRILYTEFPRI